jgi:hypothetical protein
MVISKSHELDIGINHFTDQNRCNSGLKGEFMRKQTRLFVLLVLLSLVAFMASSGRSQDRSQNPSISDMQSQAPVKSGVAYVCACLRTKSCFCMTEAKMEGPCACGTQGGPPMKAVSPDSDWAKENREALAQ